MYLFSGLLGWVIQVATGVVLSVIQEMAKKYPILARLNQKMVAVGLTLVAGAVAALFEFGLGIDLFKDVTTLWDLIQLLATVFAFGQATYALRRG